MPRINVPASAYKAYANGEMSRGELDELEKFASVLEKSAAAPAAASKIGPGHIAAAMVLAPLAGEVAAGASKGIRGMYDKMTFDRDLNRILSVNPNIGSAKDPNVRMAYSTMRNLNPKFSKDPLVGSSLLQTIMMNRQDISDPRSAPRIDQGVAKELQKAMGEGREDSFEKATRSAFQGGMKDILGTF